jgi:hypothetical protein
LTSSPPSPTNQQTTASRTNNENNTTTHAHQHQQWNKDAYYHPKLHYVTEGLKSNQSAKQYEYQFNAFLRYLGLNPNPDDKEPAEEICQCASCTAAREKKQISQCDKDRILQYLPMKMFREQSPGFTTELSSNPLYWKLGRRG